MSQRQLSRNCNDNEQRTQEQMVDDLSRIVEEQSDDECPERFSRYDPKELRDAARILSPLLKLTNEVNNPYARLVAAELCDTFYNLFYPTMDPLDVKKSFKPLLMSQKSMQIWNEFRLYTPDTKCKEWVPLCKEPIVEIKEECDPCRPQDEADCGPADQQQRPKSENFNRRLSQSNNRNRNHTQNCDINEPPASTIQSPERVSYDYMSFSDSDDTFYDVSSPNNRNPTQNCDINEPPAPTRRESPERVNYNSCFSDLDDSLHDVNPPDNMLNDSHQNLCNISPPNNLFDDSYQSVSDDDRPANTCCDQQLSAGSDSLPVTQRSKPNVQNTMSYRAGTGNRINYSRLSSKDIQDKSDDVECNERLPVDTYLYVISEETIDKNETDNSALQQVSVHRQRAGNDVYLSCSEFGSSTDSGDTVYNDVEDPIQYEYYTLSRNSPSPSQNANGPNVLRTEQTSSPNEPKLRTNALGDIVNNYGGDVSDSDESPVNVNQIAKNAEVVANAFTTVSLAQQEVERRKNAFSVLTKNYFNNASNPVETDPPSAGTRSTKKMLKPICKNPPNTLMSFDNSEWNDNCFRDKDFVRLLPFFEIVHNQLEFIAETQRDYGFNMLDDIMSVFYHIHYELGDPRLKNDLLIEHVKLVTKNTWESFFYPANQKMPAIPEKPDRYFSQSPQQRSMSQHSSPIQVNSRQASPISPNQLPTAPRQISPEPPRQEALPSSSTGQSGPRQEQRPRSSTDVNRRPRSESRSNRAPDVPQQTENPPVATKKNFLRKSQASGTPKAWVPKVKAVERPKEVKTFKAKPLPKFVRDRINKQNENC